MYCGAVLVPPHGIPIPHALIVLLAENDILAKTTEANGNCVPHAFAIGRAGLARRNPDLKKTNAYKVWLGKAKAGLKTYLDRVRQVAADWMTHHGGYVV